MKAALALSACCHAALIAFLVIGPSGYPGEAARRREEGTVVLGIHVTPDGLVDRLDVLRSTGYRELDAAAQTAVRNWHFLPQFRDGSPVATYREQAITFTLKGRG